MEALGQRRAAHLLGNFVLEKIRIKPGRQQSPEMKSPASVGLLIGSTPFLSWRCGQAYLYSVNLSLLILEMGRIPTSL